MPNGYTGRVCSPSRGHNMTLRLAHRRLKLSAPGGTQFARFVLNVTPTALSVIRVADRYGDATSGSPRNGKAGTPAGSKRDEQGYNSPSQFIDIACTGGVCSCRMGGG